MGSEVVIGIDLGTTNSCVAVVEGGTPTVIPNREGSRTTPSIVAFTTEGERLVGHIAKRQAITNPSNTIYAVKRLIGRKFRDPEVKKLRSILPYTLVEAENGDVRIFVHGKQYSPQEISAMILQEIKSYAEEYLGREVKKAVITVPAYFDDAQRQATKDAGKIAGLEVIRIINEPTAAALAYGLSKGEEDAHIAVYDMGGGTFDISILTLNKGLFEVRSTAGDTYLGGEDLDQKLMDWLIKEFEEESGINLRNDRMALQRLKEAVEKAKCKLSSVEEVSINLPFIAADDSGPKHLMRTLTRKKFEELVAPIIEKTEKPCFDALDQADLKAANISHVLLVGGQTRSPIVQKAVERIFKKKPTKDINPDEVVAIGAAIQGAIIQGEVKGIVLLDVTPLSLGIETHGGLFHKIIERNSTIPTRKSKIFTTVVDNQDKVEIHVLQGEREIASENKSLAKFELVGIPPAPRGVPQIEVTFAIDSNGIVNVSAKDLATGKSQSVQINPSSGLSQEEVDRLVKEAEQYAKKDAERKELRKLKNRLEMSLYTTERVFAQVTKKIPEKERERLQKKILNARSALVSSERADIEMAIFEVNTVSKKISEFMLGASLEDESATP